MTATNKFVTAMNSGPKRTQTTNGADSFTALGVEDPLLALSFKLVRGLETSTLEKMVDDVLASSDPNQLTDLFIMAYQTRDIRGGKGERDLFYHLFLMLYKKVASCRKDPALLQELLNFIPYYGSYKDLREIWTKIKDQKENQKLYEPLATRIIEFYAQQLRKDKETPGDKSISLAGKWAPREKSLHHEMAIILANQLFGNPQGSDKSESESDPKKEKASAYHSRKEYRILLSSLNQRLNTIEEYMCNGKWSDIDPGSVPAKNLKMHRKAFMNMDKKGQQRSKSDDRVQCAQNFVDFMAKSKSDPNAKKLHGENLHPHELVQAYLQSTASGFFHGGTLVEDPVLEAQFESLCHSILNPQVPTPASLAETTQPSLENEKVEAKTLEEVDSSNGSEGPEEVSSESPKEVQAEDKEKKSVLLSKMCVMLDTSGSMQTPANYKSVPPILPAMALTALITRINHPVFRHFYIRFSQEAEMMRYAEPDANPTLCQILNFMSKDGIVANTNFQKAYQLILRLCVEHKVPEEDLPEYLLVLSDMQFDAALSPNSYTYSQKASASFTPHYELIQKEFRAVGYNRVPKILFWNLNGNTSDFPANKDSEGVEMISGFSAALLKHFLAGEMENVVPQGQQAAPAKVTPYDTLRKQLDDERYDPVRNLFSSHPSPQTASDSASMTKSVESWSTSE